MADRTYYTDRGSNIPKEVELSGVLEITGGAGAVASTSYFPGGTFTRNGAGDYFLTLTDTFNKLVSASILYNVNGAAADLVPQMYSETVATTKIVKFRMLAAAVATDPADTSKIYVTLRLRNSGLT